MSDEITYRPGQLLHLYHVSICCGGSYEFVKTTVNMHQDGFIKVCREVRHEYMPVLSARIKWQAEGWKYTKRCGWLCPACARVHTRVWKKKRGKK